jgi:hypothetical protein
MANPGGSNASRGLNDANWADEQRIYMCKCSSNNTPPAASDATAAKLHIAVQPVYSNNSYAPRSHQQPHGHEQLQPWF